MPEFSLCRPVRADGTFIDITAPEFVARADRAFVRHGGKVVVDVTAQEDLAQAPRFYLGAPASPRDFAAVALGGRDHRFVIDVLPSDPEGPLPLRFDALDGEGNAAEGAVLPVVIVVDNVGPTLETAASNVSPPSVRRGARLSARAVFSEAVAPGATLRVVDGSGSSPPVSVASESTQGSTVSFTYVVPASGTDGTLGLSVEGVTDLAGNALVGSQALTPVAIDSAPPVVGAMGVQGKTYSANSPHNRIRANVQIFNGAAPDLTATATVCVSDRSCVSGFRHGDLTDFIVDATYPAQAQPVSIFAIDGAGNVAAQRTESVTFDFVAPRLLGKSTAAYVAPPGCPLEPQSIVAATEGSGVALSFSTDEAVSTMVVTAGSLSFDAGVATAGQRDFVASATLPSGVMTGALNVTGALTDPWGNSGNIDLGTLAVDATPPAVAADQLVYRRIPWGAEATQGLPQFTLTADAGAMEPRAFLTVSTGALGPSTTVLGTASVEADGSLVPLSLLQVDAPEVFVRAFDSACNANAASATRVLRNEWWVSLGRKVAGNTLLNPHVLLDQPMTDETSDVTPLDSERPVPLARQDGQQLSTTSMRSFVRASPGLGRLSPQRRLGAASAYDTQRQRWVLFGGGQATSGLRLADTWEWDGAQWVHIDTGNTGPSARFHHAMAYDRARRRVVLFGGNGETSTLSDTWEWNGTQWKQVAQGATVTPAPRVFSAMSYDEARGRIVMYGGYNGGGARDDVWEFDGARWVEVATTGSPSPAARERHAMVYDSVRGGLVVVGGYTSAPTDEVWLLKAKVWTKLSLGGAMFLARTQPVAAFDEVRGRVVVFGGLAGNIARGDVFEIVGNAWVKPAPSTVPDGRHAATAAFDAKLSRVVFFGGQSPIAGTFNDTWTWDGTAFGNVSPRAATLSPRTGATAFYDAPLQRVSLFGGTDETGPHNDLWEWNGARWAERVLDGGAMPSPRYAHASAFDSSRNRLVVFSGSTESMGQLVDTWEFDGARWHDRTPAGTSPPSREFGAMAFDSARGRTVLFGGVDVNAGFLSDTWEWNGTSWAPFTPTGPWPPARKNHALAFDAARGRTVLFGGQTQSAYFDDVWEWNGMSWTQVVPVGPKPTARFGARATYDNVRGRVVMFGGHSSTAIEKDAWSWSGTAWSLIVPAGLEPQARLDHALAYDVARNRLVATGGRLTYTSVPINETWELGGTTWVNATPTQTTPPRRIDAAAAYDALRERVVLFGGTSLGGKHDDTWEWNGTSWAEVNLLGPRPPARSAHAMAYNSQTQRVMLFGGDGPSSVLNDVWTWNGALWQNVATTGAPPPQRKGHGVVFDNQNNRLVVFGGSGPTATLLSDTWHLTGTAWTDATPAGTSPSPRMDAAMVFDSRRGLTVLFGGRDANAYLSDTWEWNGTTWSPVTAAVVGGPFDGRARAAASFDSIDGRMVLFGGVDARSTRSDTWAYDGVRWSNITPLGVKPSIRQAMSAAYDAKRGQTVMFGGVDLTDPYTDTWVHSFSADTQVAHAFRVANSFLQLPVDGQVTTWSVQFVSGGQSALSPGAAVQLWDGWQWTELSRHTSPDTAPSSLTATVTTGAHLNVWNKPPWTQVRVVPVGRNAPTQAVRLTSDLVEVKVSYLLAP